jgi:excisionase family DNA binding protein
VELTALEAAELLGVDKSTVVRWLQNDTLAGWRTVGGHWRVPATEVARLKNAN